MNWKYKATFASALLTMSCHALAQVSFYENEGFRGRVFRTGGQVANFAHTGFNDRASSVVVEGGNWEVCEDANFAGRCVLLHAGSYDSLQGMRMENRISSVRQARFGHSYEFDVGAPMQAPNYDYRRRPNEVIYEAPVTSVHAVVSQQDRRCWIERERVTGGQNVGGAIVGGLLGGVLGHQIGGGRGRDIATAGGAVTGAMIGANSGRDEEGGFGQRLRRCDDYSAGAAEYWDVTYRYRGVDHQVQMSHPPGRTVAVNRNGDPRQ